MRTGWVNKIGAFPVGKHPQGTDFGAVALSSPPKGCGHTTEGTGEIPNYSSSSPHFTIGRAGISQHRQLGRMAGTLRNEAGGTDTNRLIRVQFELVGFSSVAPWTPGPKQSDMLAALFEFSEKECGIPEDHVWPDKFSDTPLQPGQIWATTNNPRRNRRFPEEPGWYTHAEIPENSHWDMGSCLITPLMQREPLPPLVDSFALVERVKDGDGWKSSEVSPFFSESGALKDWMIRTKEDGDKVLRRKVWAALLENRAFVAERRVPPDLIRS